MSTMLDADPSNVRTARRFVEQALIGTAESSLVELITLLTSELVTNAFLHARSQVGLKVQAGDGCVRVEVSDQGDGEPLLQPLDPTTTGGRGLALVETLANEWGVRHDESSKVVWFRLCL